MTYSAVAKPICLRLFLHCVETACDLALARAGSSSAARMAMMAMTTSSSIRVNPRGLFPPGFSEFEAFILVASC